MSLIKYQYAIDSNGKTISAENLSASKEIRKIHFTCLSCDKILIPVLGEKKRKHFRHKTDITINCSPETYLHKLAKLRFYEVYSNCLEQKEPFWIEFEVTNYCNYFQEDFLATYLFNKELNKLEVTSYFKFILLEKKEDSFIPDVLLKSVRGEKLFVEINVTHKSTLEKIKSENRIIEITITNEQDIKIIEEKILIENEQVEFLNFRNIQTKNFCGGQCIEGIQPFASCEIFYEFFVVYFNGKSAIIKETVEWLEQKKKDCSLAYYEFIKSREKRNIAFLKRVVEAHLNELPIKNCFLCRYHGLSYSNCENTPIHCKFLKKSCNSNTAANCQYYRVDPKVFPFLSE